MTQPAAPLAKRSDILFAVVLVAVLAMLFVPVPTPLLDVLLVINISFSILLLIVSLYMPNALALLSFPSILLITTLFRLSLNVASTRLILTEAYAGEVISAFGTFLIQGEVIVGVIIFTIITIVNFIVIARGSSRVSEVAARFALDALPGKQMAIDADLRAGLLTPLQARERRDDLRKESQLYGSMDGAMKFVQGDAIAGFLIIFANIIGGMILGIRDGQSVADAIQTYTILTVGDGLVTQIPALLISICAGIVVTRVSSSDTSTLGGEVTEQVLAKPGALLSAGALLYFVAILPGLPTIPFAVIGTAFVAAGLVLRNRLVFAGESSSLDLLPPGASRERLPYTGGISEGEEEGEGSSIVVVLHDATLYREFEERRQFFEMGWDEFRRDVTSETGVVLPPWGVQPESTLGAGAYSISVRGTPVDSGIFPVDSLFVEVHPTAADVLGLEVVSEVQHPLTGQLVMWCRNSPLARSVLAAGGIRVREPLEFLALRIGVFMLSHPEEFLSLGDIHGLVKKLEKRHPGFLSESMGKRSINFSRVADACQELVRQELGIRDFKQVMESVIACYASFPPGDEEDCDVEEMVKHLRRHRRRQLVGKALSRRGTMRVISLSAETERNLEDATISSGGVPLVMDAAKVDFLRSGIGHLFGAVRQRGVLPVTVVCRDDLLSRVVKFLRFCDRTIRVVSIEELDPEVRLEQVGEW